MGGPEPWSVTQASRAEAGSETAARMHWVHSRGIDKSKMPQFIAKQVAIVPSDNDSMQLSVTHCMSGRMSSRVHASSIPGAASGTMGAASGTVGEASGVAARPLSGVSGSLSPARLSPHAKSSMGMTKRAILGMESMAAG